MWGTRRRALWGNQDFNNLGGPPANRGQQQISPPQLKIASRFADEQSVGAFHPLPKFPHAGAF
jgi:hypothetical protein